jgi:hypothetical protein
MEIQEELLSFIPINIQNLLRRIATGPKCRGAPYDVASSGKKTRSLVVASLSRVLI